MFSCDRKSRYTPHPGAVPPPLTEHSWRDVYYREIPFRVVRERRDGSWYEADTTTSGPPVRWCEADPLFAVKIADTGPYWWKYAPIEDEV